MFVCTPEWRYWKVHRRDEYYPWFNRELLEYCRQTNSLNPLISILHKAWIALYPVDVKSILNYQWHTPSTIRGDVRKRDEWLYYNFGYEDFLLEKMQLQYAYTDTINALIISDSLPWIIKKFKKEIQLMLFEMWLAPEISEMRLNVQLEYCDDWERTLQTS